MVTSATRRRRRNVALASAGAVSVAGLVVAYKYLYSSPKSDDQAELSYFQRLKLALKRYSEAFLLGGDLVSGVLKDVNAFVHSDSRELPQSLKQLAKLLQSREIADSTSALTAAVFRGLTDPRQRDPARAEQAADSVQQGVAGAVSQATSPPEDSQATPFGSSLATGILPAVASNHAHYAAASGRLENTLADAVNHPDAADRLLTALTSDRGKDLVSLVVSVAVRTSTREICRCYERMSRQHSDAHSDAQSRQPDFTEKVLSFAASDRGEKLADSCISAMATSAMTVYMEKIEGIDTWDDILRSMCKEQHKEFIEQMVRASIREGVYAAFGRQPPHLAQRPTSASAHITAAAAAPDSPVPSPDTPDAAALRRSRPGSSSSSSNTDFGQLDQGLRLNSHHTQLEPEDIAGSSGPIDSSPQHMNGGAPGYLAGQFLQVAGKPEGRSVLLMLAGTAAYESAQGTFHSLDELCHGGMSHLRTALGLALTMLLCCYLHRANPLIFT